MQKLNKKVMGSKGFTLAELLVVIAILAILIAIAVPVFSGMVADANLRVNQANVRTVRSAGVTHILTNLDKGDDSDSKTKLNKGLAEGAGWVAIAEVNNSGDINELKVFVVNSIEPKCDNGISTKKITEPQATNGSSTESFFVLSDDVTNPFATVKPASGAGNVYWVHVVITDLDAMD